MIAGEVCVRPARERERKLCSERLPDTQTYLNGSELRDLVTSRLLRLLEMEYHGVGGFASAARGRLSGRRSTRAVLVPLLVGQQPPVRRDGSTEREIGIRLYARFEGGR